MRIAVADNVERCVFCNAPIPEGKQVCPICEKKLGEYVDKEVKDIFEKGKDN